MDHKMAAATLAVERYILNEMSVDEQDEFEAHFFDCPECAYEVKAGRVFLANGRVVAKRHPDRVTCMKAPWLNSWMIPIAMAASVLVAISGYQNLVVIPRLSHEAAGSQIARAVQPTLLHAEQKGAAAPVKLQPLVALTLELTTERLSGLYAVTIRNNAGVIASEITAIPSRDGIIELLLSGAKLSPGVYEITVREPGASGQVSRFRFEAEK